MNFYPIIGAPGMNGVQGPQGPPNEVPGPTGPQGPAGATGATGPVAETKLTMTVQMGITGTTPESVDIELSLSLYGTQVVMNSGPWAVTKTGGGTAYGFTTVPIPTEFRPLTPAWGHFVLQNNAFFTNGSLHVQTNGILRFGISGDARFSTSDVGQPLAQREWANLKWNVPA